MMLVRFIFAGALLIIALNVFSWFVPGSSGGHAMQAQQQAASVQQQQAASVQQTKVEVAAELIVERGLKSPGTAKFGPMKIEPFSENEWLVSGYVDSQNGFGATVRAEFLVAVWHKNGGWGGQIIAIDQR